MIIRVFYILLGVALLSLYSPKAYGQIPQYDPVTGEIIDPLGEPKDYRTEEERLADEAAAEEAALSDTVEAKPLRPLLSFYFDDSTRLANKFFAWKVNTLYNTVELTPIDTLLNGQYQVDYPFMAIDGGIGSAYLGNIGGATIPLSYFSRSTPRNFSFVNSWKSFLMTPERVLFYNMRLPYSRLTYSMSGAVDVEENLFNIVLSHNINPSTSVNVNYNGDGTKGLYINQNTLVANLSVSASHTGRRWAIHGGYIYNAGDIEENGGIIDDRLITDTIIAAPNQIDVVLQDARNKYRGHTVWTTASYAIPLAEPAEDDLTIRSVPSIFVGSSLNYSLFTKTYKAVGDTSLYKTWNFDPVNSFDSIAQQVVDTRFFVQIQPYDRDGVVGLISAGLGGEFSAYYQNVPGEYRETYGFGGRMERNSLYVYGDINGKISRFVEWDATARFNLLGYRSGDLDVGGKIKLNAFTKKQNPISLTAGASFRIEEPDFWEENYISNHFIWTNNFDKEIATRFDLKFSIDHIGLHLGANYELSQNKVYYDSLMQVAQSDDPLNMLGVYLQKDFTFGGFHLNHRVLLQLSSNDFVAPVPLASAYLSYYYHLVVVKNVLDLEFGVDGRYQTKYYGFGYNPALGVFYNQNEVELGGFPYLDAFVSAKWKRLRILVKLQNWNIGLFGGRDYFMVAHYPQNPLMLKFKFSWSFYD